MSLDRLTFPSPLDSISRLAYEDFTPVAISFFSITRNKTFNLNSDKSKENRFLKRFRNAISKITSMTIGDFLHSFRDTIPFDNLYEGVYSPLNRIPEVKSIEKVTSIELGSKKEERFIGVLVRNVFYVLAVDFNHDAYRH